MGSKSRTIRNTKKRKTIPATRKLRQFAAERAASSGAEPSLSEVKRFASLRGISGDAVRSVSREQSHLAGHTAPVGRPRSVSRDSNGRFASIKWLEWVRDGDTLEEADVAELASRIETLCRRKSSTELNKENVGSASEAFDRAAAIAASLVKSAAAATLIDTAPRSYLSCFGKCLRRRANPIGEHTDYNRCGTVIFLLKSSGPGLHVPESGNLDDVAKGTVKLWPISQPIGKAIYLAPNVPHVVPKENRTESRVSLVFFF